MDAVICNRDVWKDLIESEKFETSYSEVFFSSEELVTLPSVVDTLPSPNAFPHLTGEYSPFIVC